MPTDQPPENNNAPEMTLLSQPPLLMADHGRPAIFATRLAHWASEPDGLVRLTFAEERFDLEDPTKRVLTVVARIAMPRAGLDSMIKFMEAAQAATSLASAPVSGTIN